MTSSNSTFAPLPRRRLAASLAETVRWHARRLCTFPMLLRLRQAVAGPGASAPGAQPGTGADRTH